MFTKMKVHIIPLTDLSAVFVHGLHLRLAEADRTHLLRTQTLAMRHQLTRGEAGACNMVMVRRTLEVTMMIPGQPTQ